MTPSVISLDAAQAEAELLVDELAVCDVAATVTYSMTDRIPCVRIDHAPGYTIAFGPAYHMAWKGDRGGDWTWTRVNAEGDLVGSWHASGSTPAVEVASQIAASGGQTEGGGGPRAR